jgi:hypothetical protein
VHDSKHSAIINVHDTFNRWTFERSWGFVTGAKIGLHFQEFRAGDRSAEI